MRCFLIPNGMRGLWRCGRGGFEGRLIWIRVVVGLVVRFREKPNSLVVILSPNLPGSE